MWPYKLISDISLALRFLQKAPGQEASPELKKCKHKKETGSFITLIAF